MLKLRWPRGRCNGRRIGGASLKVGIDLFFWFWRPRVSWNFGQPYFLWLCFQIRAEPNYDQS